MLRKIEQTQAEIFGIARKSSDPSSHPLHEDRMRAGKTKTLKSFVFSCLDRTEGT